MRTNVLGRGLWILAVLCISTTASHASAQFRRPSPPIVVPESSSVRVDRELARSDARVVFAATQQGHRLTCVMRRDEWSRCTSLHAPPLVAANAMLGLGGVFAFMGGIGSIVLPSGALCSGDGKCLSIPDGVVFGAIALDVTGVAMLSAGVGLHVRFRRMVRDLGRPLVTVLPRLVVASDAREVGVVLAGTF